MGRVELSPRQQEIFDLRQSQTPPLSWVEIAARLGITKSSASSAYSRALARMKEPTPKHRTVRKDAVEQKNPELVPEAIDLASDPFKTVCDMARKLDMPRPTIDALLARLRERWGPLMGELEHVKTGTLLSLFGHKARAVLEAVTEEDIAQASLRDKAVAAGIFTDKRELLSGRPTEIISHEQRRRLPELLRVMIAEARRRGIDIPSAGPTITLEAGAVEDSEL